MHEEGEQKAVFDADFASQALQLSSVIVRAVRAVAFYEFQDIEHELYDAIRIKLVCSRILGMEV